MTLNIVSQDDRPASDVLGFIGNAQAIKTIVNGEIPIFIDTTQGHIRYVAETIADPASNMNLLVFSNFDLSGIGKSTLWRHVSKLIL
jgi:ABC-type proline/glycine betaine transport system ATPase subunit